ncbi:MAG: alpha/beta hydrolase, partial [Roseibium sp.]
RVFFGTNREIEGATNVGPFFGYNSSKKLLTGVADVTIPNSEDVRRIGEIPLPKSFTVWKITLWQQAEDPKRHFSVQNVEILEKDEFASLASEAANGASKYPKTAFVFIHGYNTPFRSAVFRSAQIAWDMRFDGPAFLYSWPAIGNSLDYGTDIASARSAAPFLDEFLELVAGLEGVDQVHLIAHSMGSEALAEVLTRNGLSFARNDETKIDQLILAAPDLDAERFLQITDHFDNASEDITLYASSKDKALLVAQSLVRTNKPRLGFVQPDGPIVHPSIFSIDVSVASTEIFGINHNTYVKDRTLIDDIGRLLKFGVQPPDDRMPSLNAHDTPNGVYWRIRE